LNFAKCRLRKDEADDVINEEENAAETTKKIIKTQKIIQRKARLKAKKILSTQK
jgi:hypothetical protein